MSGYKSFVIRVYRTKGRETVVGQIVEIPNGRKRAFGTIGELQAALSKLIGVAAAGSRATAGTSRPPRQRRRSNLGGSDDRSNG